MRARTVYEPRTSSAAPAAYVSRGSQTAETTQPTNDGNGSAEQVAINTPGDGGGDAVKPDNNGQSQQIEESVTEPDKEMKEAAAGLTKMMDVGVAWLHQYDGGKCFFVTVTSVTNKTINVRGFGPDAASFQTLYTSFMEANQIEPAASLSPVPMMPGRTTTIGSGRSLPREAIVRAIGFVGFRNTSKPGGEVPAGAVSATTSRSALVCSEK